MPGCGIAAPMQEACAGLWIAVFMAVKATWQGSDMAGDVDSARLVTIFGGSGFVGRHVVRALARDGWRIRVAVRRPELAFHLQPLGKVGQIHAVQANLRFPATIDAALHGAQAVVNLTGILSESGRQSFQGVHVFGAQAVARAAGAAGIANLVHMSAIGADPQGASLYACSKGRGELLVREAVPEAIVLRPSIVFGPEDDFFNRFAAMARLFPALPLVGGGATRFQPVYAGDVGDAVALALAGRARLGTTYELGGPEVKSFRQLLAFICKVTGRNRFLVPLPFGAASIMARGTEFMMMASLGLFPKMLAMTRDQVKLLRRDNVVSQAAVAEGRTLAGLGLRGETIEAIVPAYLARFRKTGQFEQQNSA